MAPLPVMSHPFKREVVDFTGPLATKNQEWTKFIIVHMDYHSGRISKYTLQSHGIHPSIADVGKEYKDTSCYNQGAMDRVNNSTKTHWTVSDRLGNMEHMSKEAVENESKDENHA